MLIVVKILLVAFAVFGQSKLFQEKSPAASTESGLDSVILPVDRPELVLAKRAMVAQGLCRADTGKTSGSPNGSATVLKVVEDEDTGNDLATNCFQP